MAASSAGMYSCGPNPVRSTKILTQASGEVTSPLSPQMLCCRQMGGPGELIHGHPGQVFRHQFLQRSALA